MCPKSRVSIESVCFEQNLCASFFQLMDVWGLMSLPVFHCVVSEFEIRSKNSNIPQAGQIRAPSGAAKRCPARLIANRTILPGKKCPLYYPKKREKVASLSFQRHEKQNPILNDGRTETGVDNTFSSSARRAFCSKKQGLLFLVKPFHARHVRDIPSIKI